MNGFIFRIIAMVTMLIDHIGWNFLNEPMVLTWIGRIAFPIYAFLLAEGFLIVCKDKDRFVKHLCILLILVFLSEPGYDLIESRLDFLNYMESQSNMVTLILGYLGMAISELLIPNIPVKNKKISKVHILSLVFSYLLIGFANYMLKSNFNIVGPWLVISFYWYIRISKNVCKSKVKWNRRFATLLGIFVCYLCLYFWVRSDFGSVARWWNEVVNYSPWVLGHFIAALIISFYNGKLGYHKRWFRNLYLSFYPVHMYIIGIICILTGN